MASLDRPKHRKKIGKQKRGVSVGFPAPPRAINLRADVTTRKSEMIQHWLETLPLLPAYVPTSSTAGQTMAWVPPAAAQTTQSSVVMPDEAHVELSRPSAPIFDSPRRTSLSHQIAAVLEPPTGPIQFPESHVRGILEAPPKLEPFLGGLDIYPAQGAKVYFVRDDITGLIGRRSCQDISGRKSPALPR